MGHLVLDTAQFKTTISTTSYMAHIKSFASY